MADFGDRAADLSQLMLENTIAAFRLDENAESAHECEECGNEIPQKRRELLKGVKFCVDCANYFETKRV